MLRAHVNLVRSIREGMTAPETISTGEPTPHVKLLNRLPSLRPRRKFTGASWPQSARASRYAHCAQPCGKPKSDM